MKSAEVQAEEVKHLLAEMAPTMAPGDDFIPIVIVQSDDKNIFIPLTYTNDVEKSVFADVVIPFAIKNHKATMVTMVATAWKCSSEDKAVRPSLDPDRTECVVLTCVTRSGEQVWLADLERHEGSHPTLKPWELIGSRDSGGRFITPIREALREADEEENEDSA